MTRSADHDAYIARAPGALQPLLIVVRETLAQALPDADETIDYGLPGFSLAGSVVAGYAAFAKQCGLYVRKDAISACSAEIASAGLKTTKTGVTFSPARPIPPRLVTALARASRQTLGV